MTEFAAESVPTPSVEENTGTGREPRERYLMLIGLIVATILLTVNALVCATLSCFFAVPGWLYWQVWPAAFALLFVGTTILRHRIDHPLVRLIYALSSAWLGALNFAFFASIGCWMVGGVAWVLGQSPLQPAVASLFFGLGLVATIYGLINSRWIRVSRVTIRLRNLPEVWQGRKAALITDVHLGPLLQNQFLRRITYVLRQLQPDLVFLSGDLFDGSTLGIDRLVSPWKEFSAPHGTYYVTGNHDEFASREIFLQAVRGVGIRVLENEMIMLDGVQLIGVHDSEACDPKTLSSILHRVTLNREEPSILLAHRPVNLPVVEAEGVSLQLSGHTHGGQFWPWTLVVSRIYGPFAAGLARLGNLQVLTSNGVGTWGPPLRVGTKSEIVLIEFAEG